MKKLAALFSTWMLLATAANAEGFYVGGSFGAGDNTLSGVDLDRLFVAKGIGGYRVSDFFAVEGSLVGASNEDYEDGFDDDLDVSFGAVTASLVGVIPASEKFELYAKVGGYIGESSIDCSFIFCEFDEDESGLVWGAGAFINVGDRKQFTIRLDYEEFDTDVFDDLWMVSAGFHYNF